MAETVTVPLPCSQGWEGVDSWVPFEKFASMTGNSPFIRFVIDGVTEIGNK